MVAEFSQPSKPSTPSKPSKDVPVLLPGKEQIDADQAQPAVDALTRKLYEDAQPANVQVAGQFAHGGKSGSGYIESENHRAVTNSHVVIGTIEQFVFTADGMMHKARIADVDDITDIAKLDVLDLSSKQKSLALSNQTLQKDEKVWALGHPHSSRDLYISPGKFLREASESSLTLDYAQSIGKPETADLLLKALSARHKPSELADVKERLQTTAAESNAHTEHGSSGGPFLNEVGAVVGLEKGGAPGISEMVTTNQMHSFLSSNQHKFRFDYENESGAQMAFNRWTSNPKKELAENWLNESIGIAGLASLSKGKFKCAALSFGVMAAADLADNYAEFKRSASTLTRVEDGFKMFGDAAAIVGSAALTTQKGRMFAGIALGVGAAVRGAAELIPSHLVLTKVERVEGPDRPPTPF